MFGFVLVLFSSTLKWNTCSSQWFQWKVGWTAFSGICLSFSSFFFFSPLFSWPVSLLFFLSEESLTRTADKTVVTLIETERIREKNEYPLMCLLTSSWQNAIYVSIDASDESGVFGGSFGCFGFLGFFRVYFLFLIEISKDFLTAVSRP